MGFIRIASRAWVRDYSQEHGLPTSHYTVKENVSHSPRDHSLPVEHSEEWDPHESLPLLTIICLWVVVGGTQAYYPKTGSERSNLVQILCRV